MTTEPLQMQPSEESYASLQLVAQEVSTELNEARIVLEAFGERPEERGLIERFATHLHLARGALRVAEVYGGALLAEEMEHVAQYVAAHTTHGKTDPDGLDALLRAMEQLPVVSRSRGVGRSRRAACAAAAAERPARRARQRVAVRRHAADAEPALGRAGPADYDGWRRRARRARAAAATALPDSAAGADSRREHDAAAVCAGTDRRAARGHGGGAAAVPALVGRRRRARGAARKRRREQRLDQAPAWPRRPRDSPPARYRRAALQREPSGRAAQQPALLCRPRVVERSARERCAPLVRSRRPAARQTIRSTRPAKRCRRRAYGS